MHPLQIVTPQPPSKSGSHAFDINQAETRYSVAHQADKLQVSSSIVSKKSPQNKSRLVVSPWTLASQLRGLMAVSSSAQLRTRYHQYDGGH
jgi:hypothetical protein